MLNTKIIIASTRPGRKGLAIGNWIHEIAKQETELEVEILDLAVFNLPFLDEAAHPRLQQYEHQHTKDWSAKIGPAEAFIFVMPEYNFGFNAPLKNAIDFLYREWQNKPVGLVSYGGVSAGLRAAQMLRPVLAAVSLVAIPESVAIPQFTQFFSTEGQFNPSEQVTKSAQGMMKGLVKWGEMMRGLR